MFGSVGEILKYVVSNKRLRALLLRGAVCYGVQGSFNF